MQKFKRYTLDLPSNQLDINHTQVMAILNVTPDSFWEGSRCDSDEKIANRVQEIVEQGADMIDIGAYSTRPGADEVTPAEEFARLQNGMRIVKQLAPGMPTSVDTFRADVARRSVEELGVDIINDVSGGTLDPGMFATVAQLQVPYILMHMRGTPATMQQEQNCRYPGGVTADVVADLKQKARQLQELGAKQIILDPGYGFSKTVEQNYELLAGIPSFHDLHMPVLVGISRKSMIYKLLGCTPLETLNGTSVLNTIAMLNGAHFIRVHDVQQAVEARRLVETTYPQLYI